MAENIRYAILREVFFGHVSFGRVGTNLPITNTLFCLYAVVTLITPTTETRVFNLLSLSQSATVVPTNPGFTSDFISNSLIPLLIYGSLDIPSDKSSSDSVSNNISDEEHIGESENVDLERIVGDEHLIVEQHHNPEDNQPDDTSGSDSSGILSIVTFYNQGTEMANVTARINRMMRENPHSHQAYLRALRALERTTTSGLSTLLEDKICVVCQNKIIAGVHNVKLGLECVRCYRAQLYHYPCLLSWMLSIHQVPACEYCRTRGGH
jgi:hypothetical protein